MIETSSRPSDLDIPAYAQRIAPLLDGIFGNRPLSDPAFSQPLLEGGEAEEVGRKTLEIADLARELMPHFPGSPLASLQPDNNHGWSTLSDDLARLKVRNQRIREGNRRAQEERAALAEHRQRMQSTVGRRLLARVTSDLHGFQGNRHPLQEDQPEHEIPTDIEEPRLVGDAGERYHRTTEVTLPYNGVMDTVTITETALDATLQVGDQEYDLTLQYPGPKLTICNRVHDSEGFLSRNVVWNCYPASQSVIKREAGRMGPIFVHPSLKFGYYVRSDYLSDVESLAQILQIARAVLQ